MMQPFFLSKVLTILTLLTVVTTPVNSVYIAINPERLQLMKDALSWLTLRRTGNLVPQDEVEQALLGRFKQRYTDSKAFRSFVIAFHQGVLPKLTLQENEACDPSYVWKYKNPVNHMVYWHSMKKFTFESYKKRKNPSIQYCDYRQGLVCNPSTSKCECLEGSKMRPIASGSSINRCLLDANEVCALPDFDHGGGPWSYKTDKITNAAFNLEKPLGCKDGTICRTTLTQYEALFCHDPNITDPSTFYPPTGAGNEGFVLDVGHECSLDLVAEQGECDLIRDHGGEFRKKRSISGRLGISDKIGNAPGYYCYNFGPRRSLPKGSVSRTGFCADKLGSWQIKFLWSSSVEDHSRLWTHNFIMGFVHRRSVPFNQKELHDYYDTYIEKIHEQLFPNYHHGNVFLMRSVNDTCNVTKTDKMVDIWKYYAGLEEDPPSGQDFVASATKPMLYAKLQEMMDLVNGTINDGKFCKVYWSFERNWRGAYPSPPLRCVKAATPSGNNDGTCQVVNDDSTKPFAEKVQELSNFAEEAVLEGREEEDHVDHKILNANPEPPCTPKQILQKRKRSLETLEGGDCPANSICYLNYGDSQGIYDYDCELESDDLEYACLELKDDLRYGHCEGPMLDRKIAEEVEKIGKGVGLGRGSKCNYQLEKQIRDGLENGQWNGNKYKLLTTLIKQNGFKTGESGQFCDRTKLLECTNEDDEEICQCVDKTEPRMTTLKSGNAGFGSSGSVSLDEGNEGDTVYQSDYCYLKEGPCTELQSLLDRLTLTQTEIDKIWEHYGKSDSSCMEGNTCVFVDQENLQCTTDNTGKTGHDLKPRPTTPKPKPGQPGQPGQPGGPLGPPRRYGGADGNSRKNFGILGWSLTLFTLLI